MKLLLFAVLLTSSWVSPSVSDGESYGSVSELNLEENSAAFWFSQTDAQDEIASKKLKEELLNPQACPNDRLKSWTDAENMWNGKSVPKGLRKDHMIAVSYYTHSEGCYKSFNNQTARYGDISKYNEKFQFKGFHYLLTVALQRLKTDSKQLTVFRGTKVSHSGKKGTEMRFGRFASTSLSREQAEDFGKATLFHLNTTYGALIQAYSFFVNEKEVLIPPYEKFEIVSAEGSGASWTFTLRSRGYEGVEVGLEEDGSGKLRVYLKSYLPWWAWLLIAMAILLVLVGAGFVIFKFCCQD